MGNDSDMAIMQAIITVGHCLGLGVVVEGVETAEQHYVVKDVGCDLAQGFLYARPMPANEMPAFLANRIRISEHSGKRLFQDVLPTR
jgi:EAL domain-containing protein (putative c-di-GMP-specific phosphodiesterase class I)